MLASSFLGAEPDFYASIGATAVFMILANMVGVVLYARLKAKGIPISLGLTIILYIGLMSYQQVDLWWAAGPLVVAFLLIFTPLVIDRLPKIRLPRLKRRTT